MKREMGDTEVCVLDAHQVREETGSRGFVGGVLNPGSGGIHPLNYLRGLARGVAQRGVPIFQESPVLALRHDGDGVIAETPGGRVRARHAIIATEKLSPNLAGSLMPTGRTYTETKRMMRWFRKVDDRVIFGGRGAFGKQDSESAFEALRRAMVGIFPELADVPLAFRWSGLVGMTLDSVPHVGRIDDRTLYS